MGPVAPGKALEPDLAPLVEHESVGADQLVPHGFTDEDLVATGRGDDGAKAREAWQLGLELFPDDAGLREQLEDTTD